MRKIIYISFLLLSFLSAAQAQDKKYVYVDSLLIKDEQGIETYSTVEKVEKAPVEDHTLNANYQNEKPDTTLYLNNLNSPADSIQYWKNLK